MKRTKRTALASAGALLLAVALTLLPARAEGQYDVSVNGRRTVFRAALPRDGILCVPLRAAASSLLDTCTVTWNSAERAATVRTDTLYIRAVPGTSYIEANGRVFYSEQPVYAQNGTLYVPLRALCRAADATVRFDGARGCAVVETGSGACRPGDAYYNADSLYWLSRIISAESRGEPLRGQIAVGCVVLNRVASSEYPNSVYGVVFDNRFGPQFTPAATGAVYDTPAPESVKAAKICLEGCSLSDRILYFLDPSQATSFWIVNHCTYVFSIGAHDFYA